MPPFHYHIKIELYAAPDPRARAQIADQIWVPSPGSTVFDDLPSHTPRSQPSPTPPEQRPVQSGSGSIADLAINSKVIDCGRHRGTAHDADNRRNIVHLSERQWRARAQSPCLPKIEDGIGPNKAAKDWRFGRINIESFDTTHNGKGKGKMAAVETDGEEVATHARPAAPLGPNLGGIGHQTKARYIPLETKNTEAGWGIVHLYREADEAYAMTAKPNLGDGEPAEDDDEGTILCIPAVPRYMDSRRFLVFIGDHWRAAVSHFRMILTSSMDKYMVLMRFRDPRRAREWRKEFDGKPFDDFTDLCHVTFIKSITVETPNRTDSSRQGSELSPVPSNSINPDVIHNLRPFPPPTPSLVELPTCAVCLERMDDTAGLMTILCQHVFHCTCLQTWKNGGCPVCRATTPKSYQEALDPSNPYSKPFGQGVSNLCSVCDCPNNLWICLICGNVGCGRYEKGHAKEHWKETSHSFSLELETQHVWDYGDDRWVHRLIRDKGDGKIVELPSNSGGQQTASGPQAGDVDVVPRAKIEGIGLEYTHLLTSQLESQRTYFEDMVKKAADKAAKAAATAESAHTSLQKMTEEFSVLKEEHRVLKEETIPSLEKDLAREKNRAARSADLARNLTKSLQEEKEFSAGLLARIEHIKKESEKGSEENKKLIEQLRKENEELKEANEDMIMFISGQEKLKEMEAAGEIQEEDLAEGTVGVAEGSKKKRKGKK